MFRVSQYFLLINIRRDALRIFCIFCWGSFAFFHVMFLCLITFVFTVCSLFSLDFFRLFSLQFPFDSFLVWSWVSCLVVTWTLAVRPISSFSKILELDFPVYATQLYQGREAACQYNWNYINKRSEKYMRKHQVEFRLFVLRTTF